MSKSRILFVSTFVILAVLFLFFGDYKFNQAGKINDFLVKDEQAGELTQHYHEKLAEHLSKEVDVNHNAVVFLGDSITEYYDVTKVDENAINYGISMDTTVGLIRRIPDYQTLNNASLIFLLIGVNDINRYNRSPLLIAKKYDAIIKMLPESVPVVFADVLPVDERVGFHGYNIIIKGINQKIDEISRSNSRVTYLELYRHIVDETGNLSSLYHDGDGVHLNKDGYKILTQKISRAVKQKALRQ